LDGSREMMLIEQVMKTLEDNNKEEFEEIIFGYNKITPFDKLKSKLLVKIKEQLMKEAAGEIDPGLS